MAQRIPLEILELDALLADATVPGMPDELKAMAPEGTPHALVQYLPDMKRMARNGMSIAQIAAWLGYSAMTLEDAAARFPDVRRALISGRMVGVDLATSALFRNVEMGETQAIKLYLEAKGGWAKPKGGPSTVVQVNTGSQAATIDALPIDTLAADHSDLLDRVAAGDFEAPPAAPAAPLALPAPSVATLDYAGFRFEADAVAAQSEAGAAR